MLRQPFTWIFIGFLALWIAVFVRQHRRLHERWPDVRAMSRKPFVWIIVGFLVLCIGGIARQQRQRREQWPEVQATLAAEQQKGLGFLRDIGPPPNATLLGPPEIYRNSTPNEGQWRNAQVALSISSSYRSLSPAAEQDAWLRERLRILGWTLDAGRSSDSASLKARKGNWEVMLRHKPHPNGVYPNANLRLSLFWDYTTRSRDLTPTPATTASR